MLTELAVAVAGFKTACPDYESGSHAESTLLLYYSTNIVAILTLNNNERTELLVMKACYAQGLRMCSCAPTLQINAHKEALH